MKPRKFEHILEVDEDGIAYHIFRERKGPIQDQDPADWPECLHGGLRAEMEADEDAQEMARELDYQANHRPVGNPR